MGHVRLGILPASKKWKEIVAYLSAGDVSVDELANKVADACDKSFEKASDDPAFQHTMELMFMIPMAAQKDDLRAALSEIGLHVPENPSRTDIIGAFAKAIEGKSIQAQSDLYPLSKNAGIAVLNEFLSQEPPAPQMDFFAEPKSDVHRNLEKLAAPVGFADLTQNYFARLAKDNIRYFMERELPAHVGQNGNYKSIPDLSVFDRGVDHHCKEGSFIMREFAETWYPKLRYHSDKPVSSKDIRSFAYVAVQKMRKELHKRNQDAPV